MMTTVISDGSRTLVSRRSWMRWLCALATLIASCTPADEVRSEDTGVTSQYGEWRQRANAILDREVARIEAEMGRIDSIFQPLPLLRPAQEAALRRFGNDQQLAQARRLGVGRMLPEARIEELLGQGDLVRLESSDQWIVRDLDHSAPLAVPAVAALLTEIGRRFQERLGALGAPAFRLEVTSVMRTAADQEALRRINPNAAVGESTHEYGTTVDVLYSAFSAPANPIVEIETDGEDWLFPYLEGYAATAAERVAGRRALELKAILGETLIQMQNEGLVMVTHEQLQPVYHMTVAEAL